MLQGKLPKLCERKTAQPSTNGSYGNNQLYMHTNTLKQENTMYSVGKSKSRACTSKDQILKKTFNFKKFPCSGASLQLSSCFACVSACLINTLAICLTLYSGARPATPLQFVCSIAIPIQTNKLSRIFSLASARREAKVGSLRRSQITNDLP